MLITVYGFGTTATAFVLPDYLTRVQGLRALQIGDVLNWIALPPFVLVPATAIVLRWVDARLLIALGFAVIAVGSWMDSGLTHDWANADFLPSQIVESVGLAVAITALKERPELANIPVMPFGLAEARAHARIWAALAAAGTPVGSHDLQVAATALVAASAVATLNVDEFRQVPGLTLAAVAPFVRT